MDPKQLPEYRWPTLSAVERHYVVRDDRGRFGIGVVDHRRDIMWVRPIGVPEEMKAPENLSLPSNAIIMTPMCWTRKEDGTYAGFWADDNVPTYPATVPEEMIRRLNIVDDLGWIMLDQWADVALAGSDQMGHWDYGATLGKVAASALGRLGGRSTSPAKTTANRAKANKPPKPGSKPRGRPKNNG